MPSTLGFDKIILGIDPGTNAMGYGVIGLNGKTACYITCGIIKLQKLSNHAVKLEQIFKQCSELIAEHLPDEVALEAPFYGKNVQSMLKLGRAQGVAMAAALNKGLPVFEYAPKRVKQSITGSGNSSKEQLAGMLKTILSHPLTDEGLDATDALGVAVCHFFSGGNDQMAVSQKKGGWGQFLKDNPDRIR
jgi:crossover junction endodeoxyribonuclease RuvC